MSHTANIRVVEFDLSDSQQMQSDIDTDDQPDMVGRAVPQNNWEYQDET